MSESLSLFGCPVVVSETLKSNEFWMVGERGAKAFSDYDKGHISKDDRDAILGEELFEGRAAMGWMSQ